MSKIYCENCKYFILKAKYGAPGYDISGCKLEGTKFGKFGKTYRMFKLSPHTKNMKNDCKGYKRKWWKVWV